MLLFDLCEFQMPDAARLDCEAGDAPLRVALHVDDVAVACEPILVRRLPYTPAPTAHVHDELVLLDLPDVRVFHFAVVIAARVLGELRRRESGGIRPHEGD